MGPNQNNSHIFIAPDNASKRTYYYKQVSCFVVAQTLVLPTDMKSSREALKICVNDALPSSISVAVTDLTMVYDGWFFLRHFNVIIFLVNIHRIIAA